MAPKATVERYVLPAFSFITVFVNKDKLVEGYDRVLADVIFGGSTLYQVGFHAPIGTLVKGKRFDTGDKTVWAKAIRQGRMEVVFGDTDPAEGVNYAEAVETLALPF